MNLFYLIASLLLVVKSADVAIRHTSNVAKTFHMSKYVVGFLVVAVISIMPELFISIDSAVQGTPAFGLGVLFGGNVADLTLVFAILIFATNRDIKVDSRLLKENSWYPFLLVLPIVLGLDGYYSRLDGIVLILTGLLFYVWIFRRNHLEELPDQAHERRFVNLVYLVVSVVALLVGSHFTVRYGIAMAETLGFRPIFVGMLLVGLGTVMPELFFSLRALKERSAELAFGDIFGTVISDATIVIGIMTLIRPFEFSRRIVSVTGVFMAVAAFLLFSLMRSGRRLTKMEGLVLILFYILFAVSAYFLNALV